MFQFDQKKGSNGTRLFYRESEAYSILPCCVLFLFPFPQSPPLNQNHLLGSSRHLWFTGSFLIQQLQLSPQLPLTMKAQNLLVVIVSGTVLCAACVRLCPAPQIKKKKKKKTTKKKQNKTPPPSQQNLYTHHTQNGSVGLYPSTHHAEAGGLWIGRLASN